MDVATINSWFDAFHMIVYMATLLVSMIVYYQWKWSKICKTSVLLQKIEIVGGCTYTLVPKSGDGSISMTQGDITHTWLINELATTDVLYPGVGFIPAIFQKTIRMAIVNEGDWEPVLNRSPHRENIASPDVVQFLVQLAEENPHLDARIRSMASRLATGPTRELIADPAALGSLMSSTVMKALATVSNDLMDVLKSVNERLGKKVGLNPTFVYIGLGLAIVLAGVAAYMAYSQGANIQAIMDSLGIQSKPIIPK